MFKESCWFYSFKIKSSHIRNLCADFTVYTKLKPGGKGKGLSSRFLPVHFKGCENY